MKTRYRLLLLMICLAAAVLCWWPFVHLLYRPSSAGAAGLAQHLLRGWTRADPRDLAAMDAHNPEWGFMSRTFAGAALVELALAQPHHQPAVVATLDRLLARTRELEQRHGFRHFLLPYGRRGGWLQRPARSQFVDGEIALLLGLRRLLADDSPGVRQRFRQRVSAIRARMEHSPTLSAESYPNECWTFCNTIALAALRLAERLDGIDLRRLPERWVALAKRRLVDQKTRLLVSSYTLDGRHLQGPEGSSIWLSAHMLRLVDPAFARQQYRLARHHLGRTVFGFGYAREWPVGARARADVDSGLVVPLLEASPSSSAFALLAARSFGDEAFANALETTLELGGYPIATKDGGRRFAASNALGEAVLFYAVASPGSWTPLLPWRLSRVVNPRPSKGTLDAR